MIQIDRNPSRRQLRIFAALVFPAFWSVVALLVYFRADRSTVALGIVATAVVLSLGGLVVPPFARILYLGLIYATYPVGFVVSHILLAVVYYLILTPIGLLMRILGRDPMERALDPEQPSYWIAKEASSDDDRYFRQY